MPSGWKRGAAPSPEAVPPALTDGSGPPRTDEAPIAQVNNSRSAGGWPRLPRPYGPLWGERAGAGYAQNPDRPAPHKAGEGGGLQPPMGGFLGFPKGVIAPLSVQRKAGGFKRGDAVASSLCLTDKQSLSSRLDKLSFIAGKGATWRQIRRRFLRASNPRGQASGRTTCGLARSPNTSTKSGPT